MTLVAFDGIAQVLPALVGAFYWRRASASGAIAGLLAGVVVAAVLAFEVVVLPDAMPAFQAGFYGLLVNATLFVAVSLLADPVPVENREKIQGYVRYAARKGWEAGESPPAADD